MSFNVLRATEANGTFVGWVVVDILHGEAVSHLFDDATEAQAYADWYKHSSPSSAGQSVSARMAQWQQTKQQREATERHITVTFTVKARWAADELRERFADCPRTDSPDAWEDWAAEHPDEELLPQLDFHEKTGAPGTRIVDVEVGA